MSLGTWKPEHVTWGCPLLAGKRARNSAPTMVQEELGSENEEEEHPDPYDDADVSDCEDDPCEPTTSLESLTMATER
ncbi:unnamed protein product [Urochloa humidicola]